MENVFVVTDSTADIPKQIVEELGITVVPLKVHFGEETYLDGVSIDAEQFYKKLETADRLPTTSQPSPLDFVNVYKAIAQGKENVHIISIHISSALSGTYQSAAIAKSMMDENISVTVIDSKKASYAMGTIVVSVAQYAKSGASAKKCIELANYLVEHTHVYFLVDTLHYLQKGGRIGKASALLGTLLDIKPILSLDDAGEVYAKDKIRGSKKAFSKIVELLKEDSEKYKKVRISLVHAAALPQAQEAIEELKKQFDVSSILIADIGAVIGTHVGTGTIGIILSADDFLE